MRVITGPRLAIAAAVSAPLVASLRIAPGSPCSRYCGNVLSSTANDEMPCDTGSITGTTTGLVFEQCIDCLLTSTYVSGGETDLQWLIYNLRFNMGHCLFDGATNPCITRTACGPLQDAVQYQNLTASVAPFDYCQNWAAEFVPKCSPCLQPLPDGGMYLNNYMIILEAACEQRPAPGSTISIRGDPFDNTKSVEIVPPEPSFSSVPTTDYGPISLGARVGIAFGGIAFLLALAGFCVVCIGKRRRRRFLRELEQRHGAMATVSGQGWPHPKTRYGGGDGTNGDMFETPVSQRPLRGWGDNSENSPVSAHTDGPYPRYFSPYTSSYNSPVSAGGAGGPSNVVWPTTLPTQEELDQMLREQQLQPQQQQQFQQPHHQYHNQQYQPSPLSPTTTAAGGPPAFSQWPTATQEKLLMQMHAHHEQRQTELAIGLALGGDDASLRSKGSGMNLNSNLNANGYPIESKGKEREGVNGGGEEGYELSEVESPYGNGNGNGRGGLNGNAGYCYDAQGYAYCMPAQPQAPVLHHPGYGRHHGSRPGSGGRGEVNGMGMGV